MEKKNPCLFFPLLLSATVQVDTVIVSRGFRAKDIVNVQLQIPKGEGVLVKKPGELMHGKIKNYLPVYLEVIGM